MTTVYKIRNRANGLYSTGGAHPTWSKKGKTWARMSLIQSHLRQVMARRNNIQLYNEADIVEVEVTEKETKSEDCLSKIHDMMAEDFVKQQEKAEKAKKTTRTRRGLFY